MASPPLLASAHTLAYQPPRACPGSRVRAGRPARPLRVPSARFRRSAAPRSRSPACARIADPCAAMRRLPMLDKVKSMNFIVRKLIADMERSFRNAVKEERQREFLECISVSSKATKLVFAAALKSANDLSKTQQEKLACDILIAASFSRNDRKLVAAATSLG